MGVLSNLEPQEVFKYFEAVSNVPRRTFRNELISDFCIEFAKELGLSHHQDELGNVYIYKPGTEGYENSEPVIMQGHLDMVAVKTEDSEHDFDKDPLELFIDGDKIGAKNTSLGADDGIALAYTMAILASKDIPHPPIEALFTVDEEIGMSGAKETDFSRFKGNMMFNLDAEEEGVLTVGCAGGRICDIVIPVEKTEETGTEVTIKIRGLKGGHSGNEIQLQRGNAHKMMGRILYVLGKKYDFNIVSVDGGSGANVIAQSSTAKLIVESAQAKEFADAVAAFGETIISEFAGQEEDATVRALVGEEVTAETLDADSTTKVISFVYGALDGVQCYDRSIEGAVESSLNLGVLKTTDDTVRASYQVRGSVASKLDEMMDRLELWCDMLGGSIEMQGGYPAWEYKADSKLRPLMIDLFKEMYGYEPQVVNIHAGLEGGLFCGNKPDLDIVCFGPNIIKPHSFDERLDIPSTQRSWEYIKAILKACK